ncbi:MAG: hypothetical protein LBH00_11165 [Planctomycetaceae bacterium]|nr:hypothetical protein [Planctomycetaceae bacterium]
MLRGGSWCNLAEDCRSAFRCDNTPGGSSDDLGLRVALVGVK